MIWTLWILASLLLLLLVVLVLVQQLPLDSCCSARSIGPNSPWLCCIAWIPETRDLRW